MKAYWLIFFSLLIHCAFSLSARAADTPSPLSESCRLDVECRALPEVHPACSHYCKGDECAKAKLCKAYTLVPNVMLPTCAWNVPCVRPKRIWCESGRCRTE